MKTNLYFHQALSKIITLAFAGLFGIYSLATGVKEVKLERPENFQPVLRFAVCSDVHLSKEENGLKNAERFRQLMSTAYKLSDGGGYKGLDALLATVQMPSGIPVATVAVNGAKNAALLAIQMLALSDDDLAQKLEQAKQDMIDGVVAKNEKLQQAVNEL